MIKPFAQQEIKITSLAKKKEEIKITWLPKKTIKNHFTINI